ncbi:pentatricopeptide repeat-containing protein At2g13600-like [Cryptomeria japonica]|uniref:pentatricopeptide repeat-containing protein At2g13600-like n=1 Tax=Cryptomeria japonica TaxID=3369 RepID=UPI0027DAACF5|nr:pentatricopeptide repeat-containing protein At2g13600-like [Cryptomeria japonica]
MRIVSTANLNFRASCRDGNLNKVLQNLLTSYAFPVNSSTFFQLLKTCICKETRSDCKQIHTHINERGFKTVRHKLLQDTLIRMYDRCGSLVDAREVFDQMTERDVISWNAIIAAYRRHGFPREALTLFHQMQQTGVQPDQFTFASVLPACAKVRGLEEGMDIHQSIIEKGFLSDAVVGNALVDMYAKCGSIHKAHELFDKLVQKNVVSWTAMVVGYVRNGFHEKALETFKQMQLACVTPNSTTFASILPACAKMGALEQGMDIHKRIMERKLLWDVVVVNALLDMYVKCGSIHKARELFDKMSQRDVFSWTTMIVGYTQNNSGEHALETFKQMQLAGVKPDFTIFASILPACAQLGLFDQGMEIHQSIMERENLSDVVVANALLDMYAKCGRICKARQMFDILSEKNVVSWNAMIAGYAQNGVLDEALKLFIEMPQRDVVSWTTMITGYVQNGFSEKSFEIFKQMLLSGVIPNSTIFASIIPACTKLGFPKQGMEIHQKLVEKGFFSDVVVSNALIDMYAKCGSIHKAREVFDKIHQKNVVSWTTMIAGYAQNGVLDEALRLFEEMPQKNVVSWTVMIAGYAQNGFVEKALETFKQMQLAGVKADSTTFASILPACAKMGALEQGTGIHQTIIERGNPSDVIVANALVDMYAKCGSTQKARELFDKIPKKNLVSWTTMIAGYAQNSSCDDALKIFELMKNSGTYPDHVSFICVLLACSHAGLVSEGCKHFNSMSDFYCIAPRIDHYVCMVDLLGRAGHLEEALYLIIKMPIKPVVVVWTCLLGACRTHKNIGLGVFAATLLFHLDPKNAATYVLLSNIYAEVGGWGEVHIVRKLMKERGIKKIPGCSWIEGHKMVLIFCIEDR